jgi:hypothetical protein
MTASKITSITVGSLRPATNGQTGEPIPDLDLFDASGSFTLLLGLHRYHCTRCNAITPPPTPKQLEAFWPNLAAMHGEFITIGNDDRTNAYMPEGWDYLDHKLLCPACAGPVREALAAIWAKPR